MGVQGTARAAPGGIAAQFEKGRAVRAGAPNCLIGVQGTRATFAQSALEPREFSTYLKG